MNPSNQYVVYYTKNKPDCAWVYYHNPVDGRTEYDANENPTGNTLGYARLHGYWKRKKICRTFIKVENAPRLNVTFDHLLKYIIPNNKNIKTFESVEDFLADML